jgi:hypothetical protein
LVYEEAGKTRELVVSAITVDGAGAPAVELLGQLGARVQFDARRGFVPELGAGGLAAGNVYAAGSCAGSARPSREDGERVARALRRALADSEG